MHDAVRGACGARCAALGANSAAHSAAQGSMRSPLPRPVRGLVRSPWTLHPPRMAPCTALLRRLARRLRGAVREQRHAQRCARAHAHLVGDPTQLIQEHIVHTRCITWCITHSEDSRFDVLSLLWESDAHIATHRAVHARLHAKRCAQGCAHGHAKASRSGLLVVLLFLLVRKRRAHGDAPGCTHARACVVECDTDSLSYKRPNP